MSDAFLDTPADEITARIRAAVTASVGERGVVHVGEEAYGFRNIGVELPKVKRSADETRRLRVRLCAALAELHVTLAAHALAPKVQRAHPRAGSGAVHRASPAGRRGTPRPWSEVHCRRARRAGARRGAPSAGPGRVVAEVDVIDREDSGDPHCVLRQSDLLLLLGAAHAAGCAVARAKFIALVVGEQAAWRG